MTTPLPPIYRDCRRLLVHTESMVRRFSRYHKYTVGTDLRQQAMQLMRSVNLAVRDRSHLTQHVQALVWRVDEYKLTLQLCMDVGTPEPAGPTRPMRHCVFMPVRQTWAICSICWPAIGGIFLMPTVCVCAMHWCSALAGCGPCLPSTRRVN